MAATYGYDVLGRRTHKAGTGVTERFFLNDGDDEIVEYDGSKNVVELYVPGPAIDEPIAVLTPNGSSGWTHKYFHTNHQGSVIAMSGDSGALLEGPFLYDPYGRCFYGSTPCAPTTAVPYRFTGRRIDPESGLYYYRARYYSSVLGRFLQTDPVGYTADLNLYTYVGNDPVGKTDPMGLSNECGSGHTGSLFSNESGGICEGAAEYIGSQNSGNPQSRGPTGGQPQRTGAGPAGVQVAQVAEGEGEREDFQDTMAEARTAAWNQAYSQLKAVAPGDPNVAFVVPSGWVPSEAQVEALQARVSIYTAPLIRLHSEDVLTTGSARYSFQYWLGHTNQEIIQSLRPGEREPLTVAPGGTVEQGNVRVFILQQRGFDVDTLPRVPNTPY